jgi:Flp pilus assembly protein TadD
MADTQVLALFKEGLTLLRNSYSQQALKFMQRAADLEQTNPYYMSYLGVALARAERRWAEAERLCDTAVQMKRNQAQFYLNLAEVYMAAGRKEDALEVLRSGLIYARRDVRLNIAINRLTRRRRPVLPFLTRKHPLNRNLGMLRHRTLQFLGYD